VLEAVQLLPISYWVSQAYYTLVTHKLIHVWTEIVERCRCQWRPEDTQSNSPMFSSIREVPQFGSMPPIPPSLIMYC